jgi:hypothetical protein
MYSSVLLIAFVMMTSTAVMAQPATQNKLNIIANNKYTILGDNGDGQFTTTPAGFIGHYTGSGSASNVQVNAPQQSFPDGLLGRAETTIAATENGKNLVVGFNDAQGFCGAPFGAPCTPQAGLSGYAYSTNGGKNWTDGGAPPVLNDVFTRGDPWLSSNGHTIFYANLAVNATDGSDLGVSVHRGHFTEHGGFVWTDVHTMESPANVVNPGYDFLDKESITMATDGSGAGYVSVTNFQGICNIPQFGYGTIEVWRTHDNGNTWQGPTVVSPDQSFVHDPTDPLCGYYGSVQQGSVSAIGPHGEVYVSWVKGPTYIGDANSYYISPVSQIMEATSYDGGRTFSAPVVVATVNSAYFDAPVAFNRATILDSPRISVATTGPHRGRLYVAYFAALAPMTNFDTSVQNVTSTQVYLKYSDNGGRTWKQSEVVDTPPATTVKRFWPVVVTEASGAVDVVYYQSIENPATSTSACSMPLDNGLTRTGMAHSLMDTYWVHSADGGRHFGKPQLVSSVTSDWCNVAWNSYPNMGDYIGATTAGTHVFAVWADGRNNVPDVFFSALQAPSLFGHSHHGFDYF